MMIAIWLTSRPVTWRTHRSSGGPGERPWSATTKRRRGLLYPGADCRGSIHLSGSVPGRSAEQVMRTLAAGLPGRLKRMPDGEIGPRGQAMGWQLAALQAHPDLETVPPRPGAAPVLARVRPRAGVDPASIELGGLGYADVAIGGYNTFARLRRIGVIADEVRFLVTLPTPLSVVTHLVADDHAAFERLYETRVMDEVRQITAAIPPTDLAIQWDALVETRLLEDGAATLWPYGDKQQITSRLVRLVDQIRDTAEAGIHFCQGDGTSRLVEPEDLRAVVDVANQLAQHTARPLTWLHIPIPRERTDVGYVAPLGDLIRREATELYLGLLHLADGIDGARRRMDAVERVIDNFGIATECGWGRHRIGHVPNLLRLHRDAAQEMYASTTG